MPFGASKLVKARTMATTQSIRPSSVFLGNLGVTLYWVLGNGYKVHSWLPDKRVGMSKQGNT